MQYSTAQKKTRREKPARTETVQSGGRKEAGAILLSPRITEKGAVVGTHNGYLFNVAPGANKKEIAGAVFDMFKVTPLKVRVTNVAGKRTVTRGTSRFGRRPARKVAYVYLRKGDTIDFA